MQSFLPIVRTTHSFGNANFCIAKFEFVTVAVKLEPSECIFRMREFAVEEDGVLLYFGEG